MKGFSATVVRSAALALACLGLAGCVSAEERSANEAKVLAARDDAGLRPIRKRMSLDEAKAVFVGKTRNVTAANYGSQISYMAPDGAAYLWFPGNSMVVRGRWALRETGGASPTRLPESQASLCFDYGPNTVNAWSRQRGGESCVPAEILARLTFEGTEGDVFGLSRSTEVPFVLPPARTTFADLRKRVGATN